MHVALVSVIDKKVAEDIAKLLTENGYAVRINDEGVPLGVPVLKVVTRETPRKQTWWKRFVAWCDRFAR